MKNWPKKYYQNFNEIRQESEMSWSKFIWELIKGISKQFLKIIYYIIAGIMIISTISNGAEISEVFKFAVVVLVLGLAVGYYEKSRDWKKAIQELEKTKQELKELKYEKLV